MISTKQRYKDHMYLRLEEKVSMELSSETFNYAVWTKNMKLTDEEIPLIFFKTKSINLKAF